VIDSNIVSQTELDYCNSLYYSLRKSQINRLQQIQNCIARRPTVVKAPKKFISHPTLDLCTGSRLMNAMDINSSHSPTKFLQLANLTTYTTYTILFLFTLHVEPASHLLSP